MRQFDATRNPHGSGGVIHFQARMFALSRRTHYSKPVAAAGAQERLRMPNMRSALLSLVLVGGLFLSSFPTLSWSSQLPPSAFLLEIPAFGIAPTDRPELEIPSSNLSELRIHVRKPYADLIDYSQIFPFVNREAAATVSEVTASDQGKLVRVRLDLRSSIHLIQGRNAIEVEAHDRRGRIFYASFVLRTTTENRNQDLLYDVASGADLSQQTPPELMLFTPEHAVELRGRSSVRMQVTGIATAANFIRQVTVNGQAVALQHGEEVAGRGLGIAFEDKRYGFDTTLIVNASTREIAVEAVDASNNRARLIVPVIEGDSHPPIPFTGKKYALIIGISRYQYADDRLGNLKFADSDARAIYEFLKSPAGGKFSANDMLLVTNEQATLGRLRDALSRFIITPGPEDMLLIFIASHGSPDPSASQKLYFLTYDTQVDRMADTALAMKDVETLVQQNLRAKRLVLLIDTCHSAGLTETPRALKPNNLVSLYATRLLYATEGRAVMTATDVNQNALEGEKWGGGHGVFSHFVLEGLRGKADMDDDKFVTVGELFRFVKQQVRLATRSEQTPQILTSTNEYLALAAVPERKRSATKARSLGEARKVREEAGK